MTDLYDDILAALHKGDRILLATIISASGSTPLPAGAKMLVGTSGVVNGTVGGGVLEAKVVAEAKRLLASGEQSRIERYELDDAMAEGGMICGGSVEVLLEVLTPADEAIVQKVQMVRMKGESCVLLRCLDSSNGAVERHVTGMDAQGALASQTAAGLLKNAGVSPDLFIEHLRSAVRMETVKRVRATGGEIVIEPVVGVQRLLLFGGGHVSRFVAKIAAAAGFAVTVVDDRAEFAGAERFPEAVQTLAIPFPEAFRKISVTPSTSIVIITRGHAMDREILEAAVRTSARYVGMIGSGKKVLSTFEKLRDAGIPLELLRRVHAPIGLDIGAVTAEEIAVSIVAELIRSRRGVEGPPVPMSWKMKEWFERENEE